MTTAGERNAITDVPGVRVGNTTRIGGGALTGTTAVLLPPDSLVTVDVRGGAPATRETAALDPRYGGRAVPVIVLTGGSSYGLAAADGVEAEVVPAAALFDLGRGGDFGLRPTAAFGAEAVAAADVLVECGNVGAGAGAVNADLKGGLGTASVVLPDGTVVAALAALNAVGPSVDHRTGLPHGLALGATHRIHDGETVSWQEFPADGGDDPVPSPALDGNPLNTVIGVIATTARLSPADLYRLANAGQDGMALAIRPAHGLFDGDTVFAASTGGTDADPEAVIAVGAEVFARALVHGLLAAESVTTDTGHLVAYRERYPRTASGYRR